MRSGAGRNADVCGEEAGYGGCAAPGIVEAV